MRPSVRTALRQRIFISSTIIITMTLGIILFINVSDNRKSFAATTGDYRSKASGYWSSISTWETYNGTSWVNASAAPAQTDGAIEIMPGNTVTISADVTADQITIDSAATVVINSSRYLYTNNGTGTDLVVNGTLNINGYLTENINSTVEVNGSVTLSGSATDQIGTGATFTIKSGGIFTTAGGALPTASGKWIVNSGGTYKSTANGEALPLAT